jgi:hypothetical protein
VSSDTRDPYAAPRTITDLGDCEFYHTIDLPGIGTIEGQWDLRSGLSAYLGGYAFSGKRVLDVGAANGLLSFFMEDQGADVVSFDLDTNGDWDFVPFFNWPPAHLADVLPGRKLAIDRINNGYWYAHRLRQSKAKVVYGSVYRIPETIGPVDVAVYGSVLLHLRDPFLALQSGLRLVRETVIIAEPLRGQTVPTTEPYLGFLPDAKTVEPKDTWWDLRPEVVVRMIGVLGFENVTVTHHSQTYGDRQEPMYTVVGRRASIRE